MIKTYFVFFLSVVLSNLLGEELNCKAIFSQEATLKKVFFIDSLNGFAFPVSLGYSGAFPWSSEYIFTTKDGGSHWNIRELPDSAQIIDLFALTPDTLMIVATSPTPSVLQPKYHFLHSTDGGINWTSDTTDFYKSNVIHFFNKSNGWILGMKIWHTTDGGTTWRTEDTPAGWYTPYGVFFLDSLHWWAWRELSSTLFRTADGGKSWISYSIPSSIAQSISSVFFFDSLSGWIVGTGGSGIGYTSDGGATWAKKFTAECSMRDIYFVNKQLGWAVGSKRLIYKTSDSGKSWQKVTCLLPIEDVFSVYMLNPMKGFAVGSNRAILKTLNGGETWAPYTVTVSTSFFNFAFASNKRGWVLGSGNCGMTFRVETTDGGNSWHEQTFLGNRDIYDVYFLNENIGWMGGKGGVVEFTSNGGQDWVELVSPGSSTADLYTIYFVDSANGWSLGQAGGIAHTSDGGKNWVSQNPGTSAPLKKLRFFNAHNGWVITRDSNFVLETKNGGVDWSKNFAVGHSNDIFIIDSVNGWIASDTIIYRTKNGGNTWEFVPISINLYRSQFYSKNIAFKNPKNGILSGSIQSYTNEYYATTNDSGKTWSLDSMSGYKGLSTLCYSDSTTLWGLGFGQTAQLYKITKNSVTAIDHTGKQPSKVARYKTSSEQDRVVIYNLKGCMIWKGVLKNQPTYSDIKKTLSQAGYSQGMFFMNIKPDLNESMPRTVSTFKKVIIIK